MAPVLYPFTRARVRLPHRLASFIDRRTLICMSLGRWHVGVVASVERGDGTAVVVHRKGDAVAIVDGADEATGRKVAGSLLKAKRG